MTAQTSQLAPLLRKDFQLFWPFGALIGTLLALTQFPNLMQQLGSMADIVDLTVRLGTVLLVLLVCHEDAVVSLKHDWLTRPISGPTVLLAKSIVVFLAIFVPSILGSVLYHLSQGYPLSESLLAGWSKGMSGGLVQFVVLAMGLAALTANIREAVVALLGAFVVLSAMTMGIALLRGTPESVVANGSGWILRRLMDVWQLSAAVVVLWLQYRYRRTLQARIIAGVAMVILGALFEAATWPRVFSVQKLFGSPALALQVQTALKPGCFPARVLDSGQEASASADTPISVQRYSDEHRRVAGARAVAFATRLVVTGAPADAILTVNRVEIAFPRPEATENPLRPGLTSSRWIRTSADAPSVDHFWLLPRAEYQRLADASAAQTQVNYSLSLLRPSASATFLADGQRRYYSGIGFCGATLDRGTASVTVDCFKPGAQPALLTATPKEPKDSVEIHRPRELPDFTPPWLDFWGGHRHILSIARVQAGNEPLQVTVTAYKAQAHFDRQIVVPGVLGGPVSACPAP